MARFNSTFTRNHLYHIRRHLELQQSNSVFFKILRFSSFDWTEPEKTFKIYANRL